MKNSIYSDNQKKLQAMLVTARKTACLTQVQVAQRVGKPQSFVAKYEQGERQLNVLELIEILMILGVDPEDFIRRLTASKTD